MNKFPHISDTSYPDVESIDAYKWQNQVDYSQYNQTQMTLGVCSVPWDVGLIHVGNAQIGGLGNVVMFDGKNDRDSWFDSLGDSIVKETKYRAYHDDGWVQVDIPYQNIIQYNYLWVEYTRLPVPGSEGGKDRFFFFIREAEYLAPNTSKVRVLRDSWQTWIYDIEPGISYMQLERGHAPMAETSVESYLSNPISNSSFLLADDVSYGGTYISRYGDGAVLNGGDMWAVAVSTGNPNGAWGSKSLDTWTTPGGQKMQDGQPSAFAIAVEPSDLSLLLATADVISPQYIQTIQGVFFVSKSLVTVLSTFTVFESITAHALAQATETLDIIELTKSQFGYSEDYADIAKLYTYPYAYLEIYDEQGNSRQVRIEETSGNLSLKLSTSLAFPWLSIDGRVGGIGTGGDTVEFRNVNSHSFAFDGAWYDHLKHWNIPTFAVMQSAVNHYDYSTHFDRIQRANDADVAKTNADNNASTTRDTADASADTAQSTADAAAKTAYDNATDSNATAKSNSDDNADTSHGIAYREAKTAYDRFESERAIEKSKLDLLTEGEYSPGYSGYIGACAWENITKISDDWDSDYLLSFQVTGLSTYANAMTSTMNGVGGAVSSTVSGAAAGLVAGPKGAVIGAVTGLVGSSISLATTTASIPLAISTEQSIQRAQVSAGNDKTNHAITYARNMYTLQRNLEINKYNVDQTGLPPIALAAKTAAETNADETRDNIKDISLRTKTTDDDNAERTYNTSTDNNSAIHDTAVDNNEDVYNTAIANNENMRNNVTTAIANSVRQAALDAPSVFGQYANGDTSVTRPMGVWCNIVTQSQDAIEQAGDYFLRFGYAVNRNWRFESFNVMPRFTYWKCSDIWVLPSGVPDAYMDEIRFFLLGGVTVWRRPEYIGHTSIYENGWGL